jgi:hypothetical protein
MSIRRVLTAFLLMVGIVLSSLHATAVTIPMLAAYDEVARPTATTVLGEHDTGHPEVEHPCINAYDAAHPGYDGPSRVGVGTGAVHPYEDDRPEHAAPEHADQHEAR